MGGSSGEKAEVGPEKRPVSIHLQAGLPLSTPPGQPIEMPPTGAGQDFPFHHSARTYAAPCPPFGCLASQLRRSSSSSSQSALEPPS